jgi:ankyrin repeat protein
MAVSQLKSAIINCDLELLRSSIYIQPTLLLIRDEEDDTLLHISIYEKQPKCVELLIKLGINIDLTGCSARTALMCKELRKNFIHKRLFDIDWLIDLWLVIVLFIFYLFIFPLRYVFIGSVVEQEWNSFELLTRNNACIDETDALNENVLHKICWIGNVASLRMLIERYRSKEIIKLLVGKNVTGARPFMHACLQGHVEMVSFMLKTFQIDVTEIDDFGMNIIQQLSPFTVAHGPVFAILQSYIQSHSQK